MSESRAEFTHRAAIVVGLVLLALSVVAVVVLAADVLFTLFGGVLLAVFLRKLASLLSDHSPLSPTLALTIVVVAGFGLFGLAAWLLAAEVSSQLDQLTTRLQDLWQQTEARLRSSTLGRQILALGPQLQTTGAGDTTLAARAAQALSTTLGSLVTVAVVVVSGIYMAANPSWYRRGLLRLFPPARRDRIRQVLEDIGHGLGWWMFGRAVSMVIVGIITTIGLSIIGVPFALGLGAIAALLDFVPNVGPIIAAVPAILVASTNSLTDAAYVTALYVAIQSFEGYVLTPLIEQRSVQLPPAVTIAAQVLLGVLFGVLGVLLATPLAAVLVLLIKRLYVEDTLERA